MARAGETAAATPKRFQFAPISKAVEKITVSAKFHPGPINITAGMAGSFSPLEFFRGSVGSANPVSKYPLLTLD